MKNMIHKTIIFLILFTLLIPFILELHVEAAGNGTASSPWDLSVNGDGSVGAVLSADGTLTISGTGAMKNLTESYTSCPWYNVRADINKIIINNGITSIGDYAFYFCNKVTSIEISSSVISISNTAFHNCSNLTSINVNNNSNYFSSVNGILFDKNKTILRSYPKGKSETEYTIPNSVTSIGTYAFAECKNLTNVIIPSNVTSIGNYAFEYCSSLTSIEIPDSVTSIFLGAFSYCRSLTNIDVNDSNTSYCVVDGVLFNKNKTQLIKYPAKKLETEYIIPNSVIIINDYAFDNCKSLTNIEIPNSVTSIEHYAFYGCSSLTSIEIPSSVTSIEYSVFYGCTSLTSIEIPSSVTSIGSDAFYNCTSLTSIEIPNSVTSIRDHAFSSCKSLTSIEIPNSVTSIENIVFLNCSSLTSIEIPNSVTTIGDNAFYNCTSLTSIEIPNSVTTIGDNAFNSCSSLTSIEIPNSVTSIGYYAFKSCSSLTSIDVNESNESYSSINGVLFNKNKTTLIQYPSKKVGTKYTIPSSVTNIEQYSFYKCTNLTDIVIPNSITSIENYAFQSCTNLTSIEIPNSVTSIGYYAFQGCTNLTSIVIPNSVTNIENYTFAGCTNLTSIVIPNSVTNIATNAFNGGNKLVIKCYEGSYAETYAESNGKNYRILPESIALSKQNVPLDLNKTKEETLQAILTPNHEKIDTDLVWSISNTNIATVDEDGKVTAVGKGQCTITATTSNGITSTSKITVIDSGPESISLNKQSMQLDLNGTKEETLQATITPNETYIDKTITWNSSDTSIATVGENGKITAVGKGQCTITATTSNGKTATCNITVINSAPESITLNKQTLQLDLNGTKEETLQATILPNDSYVNTNITWSSSDTSIATVDENGKVTAIGQGQCTITATTINGKTAECKIEVNLNVDTNGDGKPDLNIDTDGDGKPDLNVDTDGDGKPDLNVDTDNDGKPDLNVDTDNDGKPELNVDADNDGKPDLNVDTDGDGKPDLNVDIDGDGKPDFNIEDEDKFETEIQQGELFFKSKYKTIKETDNQYLYNINSKTTFKEFLENCITNGTITIYKQDGTVLGDNELVGTGMTLKNTKGKEEISLTLAIIGDTDGNGEVTPTDLADAIQKSLGENKLNVVQTLAIDINEDGEITPTDLAEMIKMSLQS